MKKVRATEAFTFHPSKKGFFATSNMASQMRYPRLTKEAGNIIMIYVFEDHAEGMTHRLLQQGFFKDHKADWTKSGNGPKDAHSFNESDGRNVSSLY